MEDSVSFIERGDFQSRQINSKLRRSKTMNLEKPFLLPEYRYHILVARNVTAEGDAVKETSSLGGLQVEHCDFQMAKDVLGEAEAASKKILTFLLGKKVISKATRFLLFVGDVETAVTTCP